jgi:hypothetical protein
MVRGDWTGEVHSVKDIQQRYLPVATNLLCTHFATFENLVGGANFSGTRRTVRPVGYGSVMVHMARGHLQGAISTLQKPMEARNLGLIEVSEKCLTMFLTLCRTQKEKTEFFTKSWFTLWGSRGTTANPPHVLAIPGNLEYLRIYFQAWACIAHRRNEESWRTFQQSVYTILIRLTRQGNEEPKMCTVTFKQEIPVSVIWKNICRAILLAEIRSTWYVVIHRILPMEERLYRIHLSDTDECRRCDAQNTPLHHLTQCGDSSDVELDLILYSFNSTHRPSLHP